MSTDPMDIDITQDLTDGRDGALGDNRSYGNQGSDPLSFVPPGSQLSTGPDSVRPEQAPPADNKPELSLRDELTKAFKGNEQIPPVDPNAPKAPASDKSAVPAEVPQLTQDAAGRYRLPDGTFASADQVTAFEAAKSANPPAEQSPVQTGMTPLEQQQFQSLPAELRQYVERTMEGLNTRAARYSEYDQMEQIIGPRREALAREGNNPVQAMQQLWALSDYAGRDPASFVMWFAESRGLNLDALLDARDAAAQNVSPEMQALQGEVAYLRGQIGQFQQQGQTAQQQQNYDAVQAFATERDADGQYKRPYLTDVMDSWGSHITAIRNTNPSMPNAEVLERAYQNACWSDPNVRAKMQQAATEAARAAEIERARIAKQAAGSIPGAPLGDASNIPNNGNRTLREEIESAFAAARA